MVLERKRGTLRLVRPRPLRLHPPWLHPLMVEDIADNDMKEGESPWLGDN